MSAAQLEHALYGTQPYLTAGGRLLRWAEGTQQGDRLGGLLFTLAIHPLLKRMSEKCKLDLNAWYADDSTISGDIRRYWSTTVSFSQRAQISI